MKSKSTEYIPASDGFEFKEHGVKFNASKYEYDLYKEEDDIPTLMVRVKRISLPNKGENWKIFLDQKPVELIEGIKLNQNERNYLRGIDGVNFLLKQYRAGWKSFTQFHKDLKAHMKAIVVKPAPQVERKKSTKRLRK